MRNRFSNKSHRGSQSALILSSFLALILISNPAYSETAVYSWQDESGAISYSDNPANAPSDAEMRVLSQAVEPQSVSEIEPMQMAAPPSPELLPRTVTQGEFAVQLVEELGLADEPTETEAVDLLTTARISPKLGQWELDRPVSPELTVRLRRLTIAAAEQGWITLSPEQSLLAFDTTSALLGLTIPVTLDLEETSGSTYSSTYRIAETPPLVYVAMPPPDIYPYYLWTPVVGGFWWNGITFPGFFVLDVNILVSNHHRFPFRDHHAFDPVRIGRQFRGHIVDHRIKEFHPVPNRERVSRSAYHPGRRPASDRTISLPTGKDRGVRRSGSDLSAVLPERRHVSPAPGTTDAKVRRSLSPRLDGTSPKVKSSPPRYADSRPADKLSPSRPVESMPRVRPSPSRQVGSTPEIRSLPPRNLPDRNVSAAVPVPRPPSPSMDQRVMPRPPQSGADAGRGPSGR